MPEKGIRVSQTNELDLSGHANAEQFASTDAPSKTDGHIGKWLSGNIIDGVVPVADLVTTTGVGGTTQGSSLRDWYGQVPRGIINGANTTFQLDYTLKSPYFILMLNGQVLLPDIQGNPANPTGTMIVPNAQCDVTQWTLTVGSAPASGSDFYIWYFRDLPLPNVQSWDLILTAQFHQNAASSSNAYFSKYDSTSFAFGQIPIGWAASTSPVTQTFDLTGSVQEGFTFDADTTAADLAAFSLRAFLQTYTTDPAIVGSGDLAWLDIYDAQLVATYQDGSTATYRPLQTATDNQQGTSDFHAVDNAENAIDSDATTYARLHQYPDGGIFWTLDTPNSFALQNWGLSSTTAQFHPVLSPISDTVQAVNPLSGSFASPATLSGQTFVATGSAPSTFTLPSVLASPSAPVLSQSAGGSLAARTDYVTITYANASGETLPSTEASLAISANNLLGVASPTAVLGASGWNVYVGTSSGSETIQNAAPIPIGTAWTEPTSGLVTTTRMPPTVNTASPTSSYSATIANTGTGTVSIVPPSGTTLNGGTLPINLLPGQGGTVYSNGSGSYTLISGGLNPASTIPAEILIDGVAASLDDQISFDSSSVATISFS